MSRNERRYDFDATKKEASKAASGGVIPYLTLPKGAGLFKLKEGQILVDILPYDVTSKTNPNADKGSVGYSRRFFVHSNIGAANERFICLAQTYKKACPICEFRAKLHRKDGDHEDELRALAPKERIVVNLIDLKNPDKGVQILETSFFNFSRILKEVDNGDEDEQLSHFWSPTDGHSLKMSIIDESFGSGSFAKIDSVHFKPRRKQYDDDIFDSVHDLDSMLVQTPYDDLKAALLQTGDDDDDADDDDQDDTDDEKPSKKSKASDDDDDDEEPVARKKKPADDDDADDDEEPVPKKKRVVAEEDDDDDADDDDAPPAKKKKAADADDDDDEEPVAKKKKPADDDDDWDDFDPKKKTKADDDDADDDDEEPVKKKKKPADDDDDDEEEKPHIRTRDEILDDDDEDERPAKKKKR